MQGHQILTSLKEKEALLWLLRYLEKPDSPSLGELIPVL